MKISELANVNNGDKVEITGLVSTKKVNEKKDGSPYLLITLQDVSGSISFPLWDDFEQNNKCIIEGNILKIVGIKKEFRGSIQIGSPYICVLDENDVDYSLLVPTYDVPKEIFDYFINKVESMSDEYKRFVTIATGAFGYNDERWKSFITCAAAERHHSNKRGGLLVHTVGVMKNMESIIKNYIENPFFIDAGYVLNKDRLMLLAIIHDIMKTKEYEYETVIKRKDTCLDHLIMGAVYVEQVNNEGGGILPPEEIERIQYSILSHHGQFGNYEPKTIDDILLHCADMIDSQIVGSVESL